MADAATLRRNRIGRPESFVGSVVSFRLAESAFSRRQKVRSSPPRRMVLGGAFRTIELPQ
jgi:hypothetical protein